MKFSIDKDIFSKVSPLRVGVMILGGVNNKADVGDFVREGYAEVGRDVAAKFGDVELSEYPVIRRWRDIYKDFGEKKARSSVEALIKRVKNGNPPPAINPLVDIYNLASIKFELPCGGEDLAAINSDIELTFASGGEEFVSLGQTEIERPNQGEIVYKFSNTIMCRNFNYRESDITKLTGDTAAAIIVLEDAGPGDGGLESAMEWLAAKAGELLGANIVKKAVLSETNPEIEWQVRD